MQPARYTDYVIALVVTVVVHAMAFLALAVLAVLEIVSSPSRVVGVAPSPQVVVELRPEMFERTLAPPEPAGKQGKTMVRTAAHQAADRAPERTDFIGERDTLAASKLPPDPSAPAVPAQEGEAPERPGMIDTFDSEFSDGEDPDLAVNRVTVESPPEGDPTLAPREGVPEPGTGLEEEAQAPPPEAEPEETLRETETRVPVPRAPEEGRAEETPEALPKEDESVSEAKQAKPAGGTPDAVPPKPETEEPGFRGEVRKKRMRGSISRRGESSLDVANTLMGRYQAQLSRAVEREWQRNCLRYREHITPGMLTIRFLLNEKGVVSDVRFLEVMEANTIQKGFTLKSIQSAEIPAMPKELIRELDGDPLELIYNFFF